MCTHTRYKCHGVDRYGAMEYKKYDKLQLCQKSKAMIDSVDLMESTVLFLL